MSNMCDYTFMIAKISSHYKSNYWCPLKIFGDFRDFYFLGQPIYWTHK